jgi:DNA-directed RNA polymerase subunit A"
MDAHMVEVIDAAAIPEKTKIDLKKLMEGHDIFLE